MDNTEIIRRFERVKATRTTVQSDWDVVERFVAPYRGRMFKDSTNEQSVEWRKRDLYDSTAVNSAQSLAASLHGSLTSPATRWFSLGFRAPELQDDVEAKEWLEDAADQVYYALQDSTFNLEANELYLDLVTFGTGAILCEPQEAKLGEFSGVNFTAVPIKEVFFEPSERGVYSFYREMKWQPSRIISKFGKENCPTPVLNSFDRGDQDLMTIVFCVYPRDRYKSADVSKALSPSKRPYAYKYILKDTCEMIGKEGGYYEMPAFIPRWRKTSESQWGHSPANIALGDILTANQIVEMQLKAAEKLIDPPQKVQERALLGDLDLKARGLTVLRDINQIAPLLTGSEPHVGDNRLEDLRMSIRQYFFVDELELKQSPAMTATEVQVRYELMQRLLGPTLGRLQADFLDPCIERVFNILWRGGRIPSPPDSVMEAQSEMDVVYLGPLQRAQKTDSVAAAERWLMMIGNMAQVLPDLLDIPDPDAVARKSADALSVPAEMMRTQDEVIEVRDQRKAAQQAQMEAETQKTQAEAMAAASQANGPQQGAE